MALTLDDLVRIANEPTAAGLSDDVLQSIAGPQSTSKEGFQDSDNQTLQDLGIPTGLTEAIPGVFGSEEGRSRLWENAPSSFLKALGMFGNFAKNVALPNRESGELVRNLGSAAIGFGSHATDLDPDSPPSNRFEQDFANLEQGVQRQFDDPDAFANDPFATAQLAAVPFAPSALGVVGRAAQLLDPVVAAAKAAQLGAKTGSAGLKGLRTVAGQGLGLTSGTGGPRGMEGIRAGKQGETGGFLAGARGQTGPFEEGVAVSKGLTKLNTQEGAVLGRFLDAAKEEGVTVNISELKTSLLGDRGQGGEGGLLSRLDIEVGESPTADLLLKEGNFSSRIELSPSSAFAARDLGVVEGTLKKILGSPDKIPVDELHNIKRSIDKIADQKDTDTQNVINKIRGSVRDLLGPQKISDGTTYDEAIKPIATLKEDMRVDAKKLGVPGFTQKGNKDFNEMQLGQALSRAFDSSEGRRNRTQGIEDIDQKLPDQEVRARAAGLGFSELLPSGLVGKSEFTQLARTLIFGGTAVGASQMAAMFAIPLMALTTTAFIPQAAARILTGIGATERTLTKFQDLAKELAKRAGEVGINTRNATIGQTLERMDQMREQGGAEGDSLQVQDRTPSLLGRIGGAQ